MLNRKINSSYLWVAALLLSALTTKTIANDGVVKAFERTTWASLQASTEQPKAAPLIVMFWSLDCAHCGSNMQLLNRFQAPLRIATVATDALGEGAEIAKRMREYGARVAESPAYAFADEPARLRYSVDKTWRGELPVLYVLQAGRAPQRLVGAIDTVQLQAALGQAVRDAKK